MRTAVAYVPRVVPVLGTGRRSMAVVERNVAVYRRYWAVFLTGFVEPLMFLGSIGVGVGRLVHSLPGPGGHLVTYAAYVAPGLLATAAMNGAVIDTTFGFFVNFKYGKTYEGMLATPIQVGDIALGEMAWALLRGSLYSCVFLATMAALGLLHSPWAVLGAPVAVVIGAAFAATGLAATTWMRSFVDFDFVNLALVPSFLFSGVFFPLARYPDALAWLIRLTPLYQGVAAERRLALASPDLATAGHVAYLVVMAWLGLRVATRRLNRLLQP